MLCEHILPPTQQMGLMKCVKLLKGDNSDDSDCPNTCGASTAAAAADLTVYDL